MSLLASPITLFENLNVTVNATIQGSVLPVLEVWFDTYAQQFSTITDTQPIDEDPQNSGGVIAGGVNNMLYGRLYIEPAYLDLGNLVSAESRQFYVWNATFASTNVSDVTIVNGDGLTLNEPSAAPYDLGPLQQAYYIANITLEGPAAIDAGVTLTVGGVTYVVTVVGSRVVLWPFTANWISPVNEGLGFKTWIGRAKDSSEQRQSLRQKARRTLTYEFALLNNRQTQFFDNIMFGWQNRAFAVPIPQYKNFLTGPVLPGDLSVPVVTPGNGFVVGQTAVIFRGIDDFEVFEIAAIDDTSLTTSNPLLQTWPTRSLVFPLMVSNIVGNVPVTRHTSKVLTGRVMFQGVPQQTDPYLPLVEATDVYNGREIVLSKPNWLGGIDNGSDYAKTEIDYETGAIDFYQTENTPTLSKSYSWWLKGRDKALRFREFLRRTRGRAVAFYVPSWHEDLNLAEPINAADTSIGFVDRGFYRLVGVHPARAHLMIRTRGYGQFIRPISTIGLTGPQLNINIGTALGVDLQPSDILQIHFVGLHRFASDEINITWHSDNMATVNAQLMLVKQ